MDFYNKNESEMDADGRELRGIEGSDNLNLTQPRPPAGRFCNLLMLDVRYRCLFSLSALRRVRAASAQYQERRMETRRIESQIMPPQDSY